LSLELSAVTRPLVERIFSAIKDGDVRVSGLTFNVLSKFLADNRDRTTFEEGLRWLRALRSRNDSTKSGTLYAQMDPVRFEGLLMESVKDFDKTIRDFKGWSQEFESYRSLIGAMLRDSKWQRPEVLRRFAANLMRAYPPNSPTISGANHIFNRATDPFIWNLSHEGWVSQWPAVREVMRLHPHLGNGIAWHMVTNRNWNSRLPEIFGELVNMHIKNGSPEAREQIEKTIEFCLETETARLHPKLLFTAIRLKLLPEAKLREILKKDHWKDHPVLKQLLAEHGFSIQKLWNTPAVVIKAVAAADGKKRPLPKIRCEHLF
ncbi:MAG: hypothetical protein V4760_10180, partial [Bdellovibrionota bacterium]